MKEFIKPKTYISNLPKWINNMKTILPDGILNEIPEEYHNKVCEDFIHLAVLIQNVPEEGPNTTCMLPIFKNNILSCYFTLLKITKYELNVVHYLKNFDESFSKQCESGLPLITLSFEALGTPITKKEQEQLQEKMSLDFMSNYARTFYLAIFETLNN